MAYEPTSRENILSRLRMSIAKYRDIEIDQATEDKTLRDLSLDSLDAAALIMDLEDRYEINQEEIWLIAEDRSPLILTLKEIADRAYEYQGTKS